MFNYGGDNNFCDRFDFYKWSAPYYENPKEVFLALNKWGLKDKTLVSINAIGACRNIDNSGGTSLYWTIADAGIELGELWWERYEHLDSVLVPWNITLCEPIQFVFDDDTTLEILPIEDGGARIGVNTIPVGLVNGLNPSEVNATALFKEFIGRKLSDIELKINYNETKRINKFSIESNKECKEFRTNYIIELTFEYPYRLELTQGWESWYQVSAKGEDWRGKIPYKRLKDVTQSQEGVEIVNGRDGGGTFWIIGISREERISDIPNLDCFGISIEDYHVSEFLSAFLYKYFDPSIQERYEYEDADFDWYGGNLYTFENMKLMVSDIRRTIHLILEDYDNPELEEIKSYWSYYQYSNGNKAKSELSPEEINELRRNIVPNAVDFYERFCSQMDNMLKIPGNNIMSFAGP